MALEGSIGEFGLVDIFQLIAMQKKSGVITLSRKNKEGASVSFLDGAFIRAVLGDENQHFADAMVSAKKVTVLQLRSVFRATQKGVSIVDTFVNQHYISPEEANHWNQMLTQEVLFDLLLWKEGIYKFNQELVYKKEYETSVSVEWILMEGMRQSDEWPALLKNIPSRSGIYEQVKTDNEEGLLPDVTEEGVCGLLHIINGERTVNEIISRAGMDSFSVYKDLSGFLREGKIRVCEPKAKIKKRVFSEISFSRMKEFALSPLILNGLLISFMLVLSILFTRIILFGDRPFFKKMQGDIQKLRELSIRNEKDVIYFSLNLYYLKKNKYPDMLIQLKKEGFLDEKISLDNWVYSHDRSNFRLEFIPQLLNN